MKSVEQASVNIVEGHYLFYCFCARYLSSNKQTSVRSDVSQVSIALNKGWINTTEIIHHQLYISITLRIKRFELIQCTIARFYRLQQLIYIRSRIGIRSDNTHLFGVSMFQQRVMYDYLHSPQPIPHGRTRSKCNELLLAFHSCCMQGFFFFICLDLWQEVSSAYARTHS